MMFCIFLMLFGVLLFTFVSGALASILANYDAQQAQLQEKLLYLNKLRMQYHIKDSLYVDIKKALIYDHKTNLAGIEDFVDHLPPHLRMKMSHDIHNQYFQKFRFFKEIGSKQFLGWIGSRLRPRILPS
jgi:hypothetical protein